MLSAQDVLLYPDGIPNSKPAPNTETDVVAKNGRLSIARVSIPTLSIYLPDPTKANGTAIIICPGGGYTHLAASHEGIDVAKALNEWGITAFVLKYRLPNDSNNIDKSIAPLQDAQRAIQLVRQHAADWHINPRQVGIMGFSAGGHLASTAGTHFTKALIDNPGATDLRPDFMVLLYPVISLTDSLAHGGSRDALLGKTPAAEKIKYYSNELQVTAQTPPAFLVHAKDDGTVKVRNSIAFYEALQKNKVPAEIHLFDKGGHGFGMDNPTSTDKWMDWLKIWMQGRGLLK
ncbi:MAG TPA: alpha/beta hydrolase [Chitinophagaceae bacterium]